MKVSHLKFNSGKLIVQTAIIVMALSIIIGCGDKGSDPPPPPPRPGTVTGVITLPAQATGKQMYALIDKDTDGDEYIGIAGCTCGPGTNYQYTFEGHLPGAYYIYAIVYNGSSQEGPPQPGDFFGYYNTGLTPPPAANVVIESGKTKEYDFNLYVVPASSNVSEILPNGGILEGTLIPVLPIEE